MHMHELRFTVWQFVRLMVHLEEQSKRTADQQALFDDWADVWTPLDKELESLAASDLDAYSDKMMDQDVVINEATAQQAATAHSAIQAVMDELDAAIAAGEAEDLDSLKFERRELRQLARKLGRFD